MLISQDPKEGLLDNIENRRASSPKKEGNKAAPKKEEVEEEPRSKTKRKTTTQSNKTKRSEVTYVLKTLNLLVGAAFIGFAFYCYSYGFKDEGLAKNAVILIYVMPSYIGLSGLLILLIECRIGFVVRNMRFFYNYFGRGIFNIYAGVMPLTMISNFQHTLSTFEIITLVAASVMCLVGILYIGLKVFCCEKEGDRLSELNKKPDDSDDSD